MGLSKDYKVKMFQLRMGYGRGRFVTGIWFGYPIELTFYLEILLYTYNSRHPKQEVIWRDSSPTTNIIIVSWWQHHQTKLHMARMLTNTCSLSCRYMISVP
jgi:hypothetical protein